MKWIHKVILEIEDMMMEREKAHWHLQEKTIGSQVRKIIFAIVGFKILVRPLTTTVILCCLGLLALAMLQNRLGTHIATYAVINGIFFVSLFLGVATTPSSYPTLNIDDRDIEGYLSIIHANGLGEKLNTMKFIGDEVERHSRARTRRWLGLVALIWSLYMVEITFAVRAGRSLPQEITFLFVGTCLIILPIVWSYGKAVSQLVAILRICETYMTDNATQCSKS